MRTFGKLHSFAITAIWDNWGALLVAAGILLALAKSAFASSTHPIDLPTEHYIGQLLIWVVICAAAPLVYGLANLYTLFRSGHGRWGLLLCYAVIAVAMVWHVFGWWPYVHDSAQESPYGMYWGQR